ncbi:MAG TPA: NAD(P)-binding domain-containing protein [Acidimicrobiales bacterium]|nr:NAD(P)-binding domain-containing protein [Acidimicrobiales bacterium]
MAATTPTLAPVPGPPPGIAPPPPSVGADSPLFEGLAARIADRSAVVAVVGLGYVGLPLLEASARQGYRLVGVDIDATKVRSLRRGRSYLSDVADGDLDALAHARFSTDHRVLIAADVVVVAVPTPLRDGRPDLSAVRSAASAISEVLRPGQLVVLESTTYPGTTEEVVRPLLEESGFVSSRDFALAYSPERIDPGSDRSLRHTPKLVAGVGRALVPRDDLRGAVHVRAGVPDLLGHPHHARHPVGHQGVHRGACPRRPDPRHRPAARGDQRGRGRGRP